MEVAGARHTAEAPSARAGEWGLEEEMDCRGEKPHTDTHAPSAPAGLGSHLCAQLLPLRAGHVLHPAAAQGEQEGWRRRAPGQAGLRHPVLCLYLTLHPYPLQAPACPVLCLGSPGCPSPAQAVQEKLCARIPRGPRGLGSTHCVGSWRTQVLSWKEKTFLPPPRPRAWLVGMSAESWSQHLSSPPPRPQKSQPSPNHKGVLPTTRSCVLPCHLFSLGHWHHHLGPMPSGAEHAH